jgi:exosome complex exonuclease RRP6
LSLTFALLVHTLIVPSYNNPYATEIEQYQYPPSVYHSSPPTPFNPPGDYEAIFVDTEEGVQEMLQELKQATEIAVDLEHHDMHSYIGLVSLMQISTRDKDWIVDPLKPWRENLQCLNEVFTDPKIIKVFHGSNMDIKWLQRDLGLYVVGLFDTYYAANALNFPAKSLKYLLERFANFQAQKKYQMADWRVRPLPAELVEYARSDTHYLLNIYDEVRNMLVEASTPGENLVDAVLEGSKKEALQVHERPIYDIEYGLGSGGWFKQVTQRAVKFDGPQLAVYRAVHYWRDQKAREWDEGEQSILTLAQLYGLAENMPTNPSALYSSLRPISKLVATNAKELISVINKAKAQGQSQPGLREVIKMTEDKFGASTVWNRKPRKSPPAENHGVGSTLQMLTKSGDVTPTTISTPETVTVIDDGEVNAGRSLTSRLWGLSLPQIGTSLVKSSTAAAQALRSIMPLGGNPETLMTRSESVSIAIDPVQGPIPAPAVSSPSAANVEGATPAAAVEGTDQIFTLRDRKRKAAEVADLDESSSFNGIAPSSEDQARKEEKKRRKAEKRAQKEAAAAATAQIEPFDYANAQSMLNAKPDVEEQKAQRSNLVNPYAKALNTGTGAKRTNVEGPGRSFTFKK